MIDLVGQFREVAKANHFELAFVDTLRASPIGMPERVLLEVEPLDAAGCGVQFFRLLQHRLPAWTTEYSNRRVSAAWVEGFLQSNRGVAWFIAEAEAIAKRSKPQRSSLDERSSRPIQKSAQEKAAEAKERAEFEARISDANALIIAANIAAGLDQIEDGSRPVSYYEYFLGNTVQGNYDRGTSGLYYPKEK